MGKKDPLGKGLSAILKDVEEGGVHLIPVQQIVQNPSQPRIEMRHESLVELASSIVKAVPLRTAFPDPIKAPIVCGLDAFMAL